MILAYDIGTSSVRTSLVTEIGEVYALAKCDYDTHHLELGISKQNPEDWWKCDCKTTKALLEQNSDAGKRIVSIGVSDHMLGCVPVNEKGEALHVALIHSDARASCRNGNCGACYRRSGKRIGDFFRNSGNCRRRRRSLCGYRSRNSVFLISCFWMESTVPCLEPCNRREEPGSDGLIFVPYLYGECSPIFDAKARGMFYGRRL